jgi:hypothetical protein
MAHLLSTRISLRWLPDAPSEPTDTLVFNVGSYFMDLRVLKVDKSIDWGMAGERQILSTEPCKLFGRVRRRVANCGCVVKCRWIKTIDSLGPSDPDEGTFTKLPDGDDLEVGSMPYPERNNEVTEYEEVWRKLSPRSGPGPQRAWILESVDGKTFLGRIGGTYMALGEGNDKAFGARREEWDDKDGWKVKYAIGALEGLLSPAASGVHEFEGEADWKAGEKVDVLGKPYVVRSVEPL